MFVRITNHAGNARQDCNLLRGSLGVTSGNQDFAPRIFAPDAPNGRPRVRLGGSSHRASVQNHNAGVTSRCGPDKPALTELLLDGSTVGLGSAAAEIFYVKAGHGTILAYVHLRMGLEYGTRVALAASFVSGARCP